MKRNWSGAFVCWLAGGHHWQHYGPGMGFGRGHVRVCHRCVKVEDL